MVWPHRQEAGFACTHLVEGARGRGRPKENLALRHCRVGGDWDYSMRERSHDYDSTWCNQL